MTQTEVHPLRYRDFSAVTGNAHNMHGVRVVSFFSLGKLRQTGVLAVESTTDPKFHMSLVRVYYIV